MKSKAGPFKMKSPLKNKKRLKGESDLDYNRRVYGINRGSRPGNYKGPKTPQVGKTVKGSVQKIV
tara:strand:+ start:326 stop:520 length:195 start_codon:yes stop_codon:yes gene_type:complete